MLLSVAPIQSMNMPSKTTVHTISCLTAVCAINMDFQTSEIVKTQRHFHSELSLPIYSSPVAPLLGSFAIAACIADQTTTSLLLAQQSIQCAYVRRSLVDTAIENLVDRKKITAKK